MSRNREGVSLTKRVGILGAGGHIGRCLVTGLLAAEGFEVHAFTRNPSQISGLALRNIHATDSLNTVGTPRLDLIINCVGAGDPAVVGALGEKILALNDTYDVAAMEYAGKHSARYIYMSSGAVYDSQFSEPANDNTPLISTTGRGQRPDFYGFAKAVSESRHRASTLPIVDLRIFGFFSHMLALDSHFLLTEVIRHIKKDAVLSTAPRDIWRDYLCKEDLASIVTLVASGDPQNGAYDTYTAAPVSKFVMLDAMRDKLGLRYQIDDSHATVSPTGEKPKYYSFSRRLNAAFGYEPQSTSLETVLREAAALVMNDSKTSRT